MLREIEEARTKIALQETVIAECQRKIIQSESETDKDRALLEQKVEFLERSIADLKKKETDYSSEFKSVKREHT